VQNPKKENKLSSIIIITHQAKNDNLINIIKKIVGKNYLKKKPKLIRIDEN